MKIFLSIFLFGFLVSCSSTIPDVNVCLEISDDLIYCNRTLSEKPTYVDNSGLNYVTKKGERLSKDQLRKESLILPLESWSEIKIFILSACKKTGQCKQAQERIQKIEAAL